MAKSIKKTAPKATPSLKKGKTAVKKLPAKAGRAAALSAPGEPTGASILDRLFATIVSRKGVDPSVSHSARLLSRGRAKVAQKFGEEAVECLIEAVAGNKVALVAESADVLYHLLVVWMDAGVEPGEVWQELERRQGVSGIAEKAARAQKMLAAARVRSTKIP